MIPSREPTGYDDTAARLARDREAEHVQAVYEAEREAREHRTDWKPAPRVKRADANRNAAGVNWRNAVLERDQGCVAHTNPVTCREGWQAHHVVPQQILRRIAPDALWNPLSGVGLCGLAHRRHHSGHTPLPFDFLPLPVVDYLSGRGFAHYLERMYP